MDKYINWFKNHKYFGFIVFICIVIIGLGSLTDAAGKISGFIKPYITKSEDIYLTLKVHNQSKEDVTLSPYVKYYITHPIAVIPTYNPTGMLVLPDKDDKKHLSMEVGERKTYFVRMPRQLVESTTFKQGVNNISFLIETDKKHDTKLQTIPFFEDAFERYYVEFKIAHNQAN